MTPAPRRDTRAGQVYNDLRNLARRDPAESGLVHWFGFGLFVAVLAAVGLMTRAGLASTEFD